MKRPESLKLKAARRLLFDVCPDYKGSIHRLKAREVYRMLSEANYTWSAQWGAWLYQRPLPGFEVVK